jgi:hypothetical protein
MEDNQEALRLLGLVFEADPDHPLADALAAWCRQQRHLIKWPGGEDDREAANRLVRAAIAPLALAGAVRAALTRDHDSALAAVDRATLIKSETGAVNGQLAETRSRLYPAMARVPKCARRTDEPIIWADCAKLKLATGWGRLTTC